MAADEPTYWTVFAVKLAEEEEEETLPMEQNSERRSETDFEDEPPRHHDSLWDGGFAPKQGKRIKEEPEEFPTIGADLVSVKEEAPVPTFPQHNGARFHNQQSIKTYTKEVVCLPFSQDTSVFLIPRGVTRSRLTEAGLIGTMSFSTEWSEDKLRAKISSIFRRAFELAEDQLLPFTFLSTIKGCKRLTIPKVSSSFSWDGKEVSSVCSSTCLYIMAGMEFPAETPFPSFPRHNGAQFKKKQYIKTCTKEVVCLPFSSDTSVFVIPRGVTRCKLAEAGLIGTMSFSTEWPEDKLRAEISSIFRGVFELAEDQLLPFIFLSTIKGCKRLTIPEVSSSFSWDGKEVSSVCSSTCLYIMAGMEVPAEEKKCSVLFKTEEDGGYTECEVKQEDGTFETYREREGEEKADKQVTAPYGNSHPPSAATTGTPKFSKAVTSLRSERIITISRDDIKSLLLQGTTVSKMASTLKISRSTVYKLMREYKLRQTKSKFTNISNESLDAILREIKTEHPRVAELMLDRHLHTKNISVQRRRLRDSIKRVDEAGGKS